MFYLLAATLTLGMGFLVLDGRPRAALWGGWFVAIFLLPTWALVAVGPFVLDLRTVAAVVGLGGLWLTGTTGGSRWIYADGILALLIVAIAASEYESGNYGPMRLPEILRQWALPYVVGRLFLSKTSDLRGVQSIVCGVVFAIAIYGAVEAVSQVNPVNAAFGQRYGFLEGAEGFRWGLKRAQGLHNHPIYFGIALALMMPWALEARRVAVRGEGPTWWRYLPAVIFACLFMTGSRAALLVGVSCLLGPWLIALGWRGLLLATALTVLGCVLVEGDILNGLSQLTGEEEMALTIHGEEVTYSGTSHRLLLFLAYERSLADVGLLGLGSQLNGLDTDDVPQMFSSMDSHYLRFALQHGWLAVALFGAFAGTVLVGLARRSRRSRFEASLCGAMAGVTAVLFTVWFAPDFGSAWLFFAGLAGNLAVLDARQPEVSAPARARAQMSAPSRLRRAFAPLLEVS